MSMSSVQTIHLNKVNTQFKTAFAQMIMVWAMETSEDQ
jgi:hypothetical protein